MAGTIYLSEKESSLRHFKDLFSKIRGFRFVDNARGSFGMERCARQLVGRVRLCFHQLFIVPGTKKGRSVRKGRSFRTWEGFEDDKRPQLAATCATAARCSPLSLSFSLRARSLRLQRDQFRGKTRGAPSCNLRWYAPSNSRASVIPALSRFHVFVPWVLILSFYLSFFLFTRVRLMERFEAREF